MNKESNVIRRNRKHIIKCPQEQQKETNMTITIKEPTENTGQTGYVTRYGRVSKPVERDGAVYAVNNH